MPRLLLSLLVLLLALGPARRSDAQRSPCSNGSARSYGCENVHLWSHLTIEQLGGSTSTQLNDLWGWADEATGRRYALVGHTEGTAFVDVTDPAASRLIGTLPTHASTSAWRDVKVYDHFALVVADYAGAHGLQVFDLHHLRNVGDAAPATFSADAHYGRFGSAHNVVVDTASGYAYAVGLSGAQDVPEGGACGPGYHFVDVRDPLAPQFAGCFSDASTGRSGTGYTHDAQCVVYDGPDPDHQGRQLCFGANETAVSIVDVTDKTVPATVATATYPTAGYVHQGWLTSDHRYFLTNDEWDELQGGAPQTRTLVWDVTDVDDPQLATQYLHETRSIDHNLYVVGRYAYLANYTSGLRILDVSSPEAPRPAGHFDVVPTSDDAVYDGAWSVYPFFDSDVVLVSSISSGLFVLQPDLGAALADDAPAEPPPFAVNAVYPNPASGRVTIVLTNDTPQPITVELFDLLGRRVRTVHAGTLSAGMHPFVVNAAGLPAGTYVLRAANASSEATERVTILP